MPRFFIDTFTSELSADVFSHLSVLRLRVGDKIILCEGRGVDYVCQITALTSKSAAVQTLETLPSVGELNANITLYCAFPKSDKAEHIVRKATELGAAAINFFPSEYAVAKEKNLERLRKLAKAAAEQSQRGVVPSVNAFASFGSMLVAAGGADLSLFCYENERELTLAGALRANPNFAAAAIITGAEGGFSEREAALARAANVNVVSLGARIMRCETAPLAVLSAISLLAD